MNYNSVDSPLCCYYYSLIHCSSIGSTAKLPIFLELRTAHHCRRRQQAVRIGSEGQALGKVGVGGKRGKLTGDATVATAVAAAGHSAATTTIVAATVCGEAGERSSVVVHPSTCFMLHASHREGEVQTTARAGQQRREA